MGLFDKVKGAVSSAQNAYNDAQGRIAQTKAKIEDVRDTVTGKKDTREFPPQELLIHQQHECIKVHGVRYNQDAIKKLTGNAVQVAILKDKLKDWDSYPVVNAADGVMFGAVYDDQISKSGLKVGYTAMAEIHRPIYYGQSLIELYIPMTNEAIERKKLLDSLKFCGNVDYSKWEQDHGERFDFYAVEIYKTAQNEKASIIVIGDSKKLFEVTPRMNLYNELDQRMQYKPRRLIAEQRSGEHGAYYRVWFYY